MGWLVNPLHKLQLEQYYLFTNEFQVVSVFFWLCLFRLKFNGDNFVTGITSKAHLALQANTAKKLTRGFSLPKSENVILNNSVES